MKFARKTQKLIASYKALGYTIAINRISRDIVKLAQTNDKMRGYPQRIVWAVGSDRG